MQHVYKVFVFFFYKREVYIRERSDRSCWRSSDTNFYFSLFRNKKTLLCALFVFIFDNKSGRKIKQGSWYLLLLVEFKRKTKLGQICLLLVSLLCPPIFLKNLRQRSQLCIIISS
jgi:hypothetical protein